jgi:hypothetical protein
VSDGKTLAPDARAKRFDSSTADEERKGKCIVESSGSPDESRWEEKQREKQEFLKLSQEERKMQTQAFSFPSERIRVRYDLVEFF